MVIIQHSACAVGGHSRINRTVPVVPGCLYVLERPAVSGEVVRKLRNNCNFRTFVSIIKFIKIREFSPKRIIRTEQIWF